MAQHIAISLQICFSRGSLQAHAHIALRIATVAFCVASAGSASPSNLLADVDICMK